MTRTINEYFNDMFNEISKEIPFNTNWSNGTGYFDYAVHGSEAVVLEPGEYAKSVDDHDRKIIFLGTDLGLVVIFKRYSSEESEVYVSNTTTDVRQTGLMHSGSITKDQLMMILGDPKWGNVTNLASIIKNVASLYNSTRMVPGFVDLESQVAETMNRH